MARVEVVLVRPESPANVGAAARVVRNTGLHGLVIVDPGDWRTVECWRTAWGAQEVLEHARTAPDLASALGGAGYVAALSGRRTGGAPALDVRVMADEVAGLGPEEVAELVFGPETAGLAVGLPLLALFSVARMFAAYALSLVFAIAYGTTMAVSKRAAVIMLPVLDILQSVPILGFFPAALVFFVAAFQGHPIGLELAVVFLIFTSMVEHGLWGVRVDHDNPRGPQGRGGKLCPS